MKKICFVVTTVILCMISCFSIVGTVHSQTKEEQRIDQSFYDEMESEYLGKLRSTLNARSFANSGITMTKIMEEDGRRSYQVKIHHKGIDRMEESERQALKEELADIAFADNSCTFSILFFSYEAS